MVRGGTAFSVLLLCRCVSSQQCLTAEECAGDALLQMRMQGSGVKHVQGGHTTTRGVALYLSPDGQDAQADGSRRKPYKTLKKLVADKLNTLRSSGGVVYLRGGTYRWTSDQGTVDGLVAGGQGLTITSDPEDAKAAELSGADQILSGWSKRENGQWSNQEGQAKTDVWCATLPQKIEDGVQVMVWVDDGAGPRIAPMAQLPNIPQQIDHTSWPAPANMKDRVEPADNHAFMVTKILLESDTQVQMSPPPFCKKKCTPGCQKVSGGKNCPFVKDDTAWLTDKKMFGNKNKDYVGGFVDIRLCSKKSLHKGLPIVAHDHQRGRIKINYSKYAHNAANPGKKGPMWEGVHSCWKKDKFDTPKRPQYRVYSQAELDRLNEWFVLPRNGPEVPEEVCIRLRSQPANTPSRTPLVQVRTRGTALKVLGSDNIHVLGINFFGTEMRSTGRNNVGGNVVFESVSLMYPERIKLEPAALIDAEIRFGRTLEFNGLLGSGVSCRMENTLIEHSWFGADFWDCKGGSIKRNTIRFIQNGNGVQIYLSKKVPKTYLDSASVEVADNRIHDIGFVGHCDCGGVQTRWGAFAGMQHHNNWIYWMPNHKATRLDTSDSGADVFQNVFWKTHKGFMIKGGMDRGNRIVHNTGFQTSGPCDYSVLAKEPGAGSTTPDKLYNHRSEVYNNAGEDWKDSGKAPCTDPVCYKPCKSGSNSYHFQSRTKVCHDWPRVHEMLRDVSVFDFRPKPQSRLANAGSGGFTKFGPAGEKTIGAYAVDSKHYSIPGRHEIQSSSPVPPHGFPAVLRHQDLMWNRGKGAIKHDVFFGTTCRSVANAPTGSASAAPSSARFLRRMAWPQNILSPGTLNEGSVYYWRVDSVSGQGVEKGPIWCFKVSSSSERPLDWPWNMAAGIHSCTESCGGESPSPSPTPSPGPSPSPSPSATVAPTGAPSPSPGPTTGEDVMEPFGSANSKCKGNPPFGWGDLGKKLSQEQCQRKCLEKSECSFAVYNAARKKRTCTSYETCTTMSKNKFQVWAKIGGESPSPEPTAAPSSTPEPTAAPSPSSATMKPANVPAGKRCGGQPPSGKWADLGKGIDEDACQDKCLQRDSCQFAVYKTHKKVAKTTCTSFSVCKPYDIRAGFKVWEKVP